MTAVPDGAEVARYLRLGGRTPDEGLSRRVRELTDESLRHVDLRRRWRRFESLPPCFGGPVAVLAATLGPRFDAWQRRLAVVSAGDLFIAQAIGTATLEKFLDGCEAEIAATLGAGETLLPRRSPGYGDLPLGLSGRILSLLDASRPDLGIALTGSQLLTPSKSVTAVLEIRRRPQIFAPRSPVCDRISPH